MEARSEGEGKGSEFILCLPIIENISKKSAPPVRRRMRPGLRILLVEDNWDASEMMRRVLELLGHRVRVVGDGPAAIEAVSQSCPDVALLDIGLPGMSGYELASKVRAHGHCPHLRLIALTGYARDSELLFTAGFDGHLSKPVDLQELEDMLRHVVG